MNQQRDLIKRLKALSGAGGGHGLSGSSGPLSPEVVDILLRIRRQWANELQSAGTRSASLPPVQDSVWHRRRLPEVHGGDELRTSYSGPAASLEEAVAGEEIDAQGHGRAFLVTTRPADLPQERELLSSELRSALRGPATALPSVLAQRCSGQSFSPEDLLFVDIETTGLCHSPLFLIGTMAYEGEDLVVRQCFARHYGEEAAATAHFLDRAGKKRLLISFNGKSFDMPYIRSRALVNGIPLALDLAHFDLLHESRRVWRKTLPNCRLQTLEHFVCGRSPRLGDIPGYAIPEAYHAYVHSGDATQMIQVIRHNCLDLITLAELMLRLPAPE